MKRVKAACLLQTLHFMLKDDVEHSFAVDLVKKEVEQYKVRLDQSGKKYSIVEETAQEDGSVIIKIKKQYNNADVGEYLD